MRLASQPDRQRADDVEQPDHARAPSRRPARDEAAIDQIGRQMHGDERELEAAGEEAEHEQHIGAMRRMLRRAPAGATASAAAPAPTFGRSAASRARAPSAHEQHAARRRSAACSASRPRPISATASGENRNWPNEPAAVPAPNAEVRHSSGSSLPNAADHDGERAARQAEADQHARREVAASQAWSSRPSERGPAA